LAAAGAGSGELPSANELAVRAEAWRPWRALAAVHLWTSDGDVPSGDGSSEPAVDRPLATADVP
ncbi:MAG TPA: hypothetical protein VJM75_02860, partial [Acidimicrobiales bacterium]|nr:hypothetical protein [Acidimicrobiales bacterium]